MIETRYMQSDHHFKYAYHTQYNDNYTQAEEKVCLSRSMVRQSEHERVSISLQDMMEVSMIGTQGKSIW